MALGANGTVLCLDFGMDYTMVFVKSHRIVCQKEGNLLVQIISQEKKKKKKKKKPAEIIPC